MKTERKKVKQPRVSKRKGVTWDEVRELILAFPGVQETSSYGTTAFKVNGKLLARYHQDGESLVMKVEYSTREVLMGANPTTFYLTDHYRCWPYVLVRIGNVDPNDLRQLFEDAWRNHASKRLVAAWDGLPQAKKSS